MATHEAHAKSSMVTETRHGPTDKGTYEADVSGPHTLLDQSIERGSSRME
jgi:hypothetical protein